MPPRSAISWSRRFRCSRAPSIRSIALSPAFAAISHANPFFYVISGFRYGFLGVADSPVLFGALLLLAINVVARRALLRAAEGGLEDQGLTTGIGARAPGTLPRLGN